MFPRSAKVLRGRKLPAELSKIDLPSHIARQTFLREPFVIANKKAPGGTRTHVAALRGRNLRR